MNIERTIQTSCASGEIRKFAEMRLYVAGIVLLPESGGIMTELNITIPGRPVPWARAGKAGSRHFTKSKQKQYAEMIKVYAGLEIRRFDRSDFPLTSPIQLEVKWCLPHPKNTLKAMRDTETPMASKPDIDNCVKIAMDACTDVLWRDDAQITQLTASKMHVRRGTERLEIKVIWAK
jgi:Holliday junction resolvase RusA-like endonuclease